MDFSEDILAYDPERKALVKVPTAQAEMLHNAGYAIGEEATQRADADGWGGTAMAFAHGVASGGTAGLSDLAIPDYGHRIIEAAQEAHPIAHTLGQLAGVGGMVAATGGLGAIAAPLARVAHNAISGGMQEINRAKLHNEPIQWERVRSGLTLGGIFGAVAEGLPLAIAGSAKAAQKTLNVIAEKWPQEEAAAAFEPAFTAAPKASEMIGPPSLPSSPTRAFGEMPMEEFATAKELPKSFEEAPLAIGTASGKYKRLLGDLTPGKAVGWSVLPSPLKAALGTAFAADRVITKSLNNLKNINSALDEVVAGPTGALLKTVKTLTSGSAEALTPKLMDDPDKDYARKRAAVEHVAANPQAFADAFADVLGPSLHAHLPLQTGLLVNTLNSFAALQQALPKDPNDPTIAGAHFQPTRKQKQDFLDAYDTVDNFAKAMRRPTPAKIVLAEQTNPEQLNLLRQTLIGYLNTKGSAKLSLSQRRSISIILGMAIVPELLPQYVQRLQATAAPQPPAAPTRGSGLGAKAQTAVTMRDMPDNMRLQMGV